MIYFYFHFHFHFHFHFSFPFSFGAPFPFFYFRSWILIENPSTVSVQLTKPNTISGNFFYTDYRTSSGKIPTKSTYFRFLKSSRKIHRIRRILVPRYFLFGRFLVDSHFRENGKYSTRRQNPPKREQIE